MQATRTGALRWCDLGSRGALLCATLSGLAGCGQVAKAEASSGRRRLARDMGHLDCGHYVGLGL